MVQNDKKFCLSCSISQETYLIWLSFMVHMCKFSKIFIFQVVREVNRQKTVQNDKKFSLSRSISQEPYIMWLSFLVHLCKIMISQGLFFIFFEVFLFRAVRVVKGQKWQKMVQNDNKFCLLHLISQERYITWLSFMVNICKMIISPVVFLIFSVFWFFRLLGG